MSRRLPFHSDVEDPVVLIYGSRRNTNVDDRVIIDRSELRIAGLAVLLQAGEFTKTTNGNMRLDVYRVLPRQPMQPPATFVKRKTGARCRQPGKWPRGGPRGLPGQSSGSRGARDVRNSGYFANLDQLCKSKSGKLPVTLHAGVAEDNFMATHRGGVESITHDEYTPQPAVIVKPPPDLPAIGKPLAENCAHDNYQLASQGFQRMARVCLGCGGEIPKRDWVAVVRFPRGEK